MQHKEFLSNRKFVTQQRLQKNLVETLSNEPHLTDSDLIELSAEVLDRETTERLRRHLNRCAHCAAELAMMQAQNEAWNDASAMARREAHINRSQILSKPVETSWRDEMHPSNWTSVAPLRSHFGALASSDDTVTIEFPIYDETGAVSELAGIIQRRDQAYHIRISATPEAQATYEGRIVDVILADPETNDELLQRKIPVNQFVFLGTNLGITTQKIMARLTP